jgi:hypothetical protein
MRETLKMVISMGLVFSPFQKKVQQTTMKVIGRMTKCQEKENLFGKMEQNMRGTLTIGFGVYTDSKENAAGYYEGH